MLKIFTRLLKVILIIPYNIFVIVPAVVIGIFAAIPWYILTGKDYMDTSWFLFESVTNNRFSKWMDEI